MVTAVLRVSSVGVLSLGAAILQGCSPPVPDYDAEALRSQLEALEVPGRHAEAAARFAGTCGGCHGPRGGGSEIGPPLVHRVYRSSHHGDAAFRLAVMRGVRAHHWQFGDMPPVEGVTAAEADAMTAWIRWLQRETGVEAP